MAKTAKNTVPKEAVVGVAKIAAEAKKSIILEELRSGEYRFNIFVPFPIIEEEPRENKNNRRISASADGKKIRYTFSEFIKYFEVFTKLIDDRTITTDATAAKNVIVKNWDEIVAKNIIDGVNYHCLYLLLCNYLRNATKYSFRKLRSSVETYNHLVALTGHQAITTTGAPATEAMTGGASSSSSSVN
jgi:hypothetical protein